MIALGDHVGHAVRIFEYSLWTDIEQGRGLDIVQSYNTKIAGTFEGLFVL